MKPTQWDLVKSIVDQALTLPGSERNTFVNTACRNHPDLSTEIEELLRSIEISKGVQFMKPLREDRKELIADLTNKLAALSASDNFMDKAIGPYRIIELLGSGGMGVVYKAKRADGEFHHEVAIKFIKGGINTDEAIQRFRMEREILATLQHPNIAQIYDGGITEDGIPYLIMEYINGMPADQYCDEQTLTIKERLALFQEVCTAIQFAHANLVVHRDLKAENIYVTNEGIVKILDFGVAKLLDAEHTETTLFKTQPGQKLWTPQYAAPEQINGEVVTTATDVYALGVLLYKLLTDTYPLNLEGKSISEAEQIIRNSNPLPPSKSLTSHTSKKGCAELRRTSLAVLTKKLKGDLDALVLKAIRKEPEYRYASASQLSEDIERYGSGIPLIARKGTLQYRTAKFIRRHKRVLVAATIFLVTAIGFTGFYTRKITEERNRAELQAQKAEQVSGFITSLFKESVPGEINGDTLTVRHTLDVGAQKIESELREQPEIQAKMMGVIGEVYHSLGFYDKAETLLEAALKQQNQIPGKEVVVDKVQTLYTLSKLKSVISKNSEAELLGRQALNLAKNTLGESAYTTQLCRYSLVGILHETNRFEEASELMDRWLALSANNQEQKDQELAEELFRKAEFLVISGKAHKAEPLLRKALQLKVTKFGEKHYEVAEVLGSLGNVLWALGKYTEAEPIFKKAIAVFKDTEIKNNDAYTNTLRDFAGLLSHRGIYAKANSLYEEAITLQKKNSGINSYNVKFIQKSYANSLTEQGRFPEALGLLREVYEFYKKEFGDDYLFTLQAEAAIAITHKNLGDLKKAEQMLKSSIEKFDSKYGIESPKSSGVRAAYSNVLMLQDKLEESETVARKALEHTPEYAPYNNYARDAINDAKQQLGLCLKEQKRFEEAEPLLKESLAYLANCRGLYNEDRKKAVKALISLYNEWGKPGKAESYRNELMAAEQHKP